MKLSTQICAALVSLTSLSALAANKAPELKLMASCQLFRSTWDATANKRVTQDLTPASVKELPVVINSMDNAKKSTEFKFSASSPDGQLNFYAYINAIDMFGEMATVTFTSKIAVPDKDVSVSSTQSFPGDIKYNDPDVLLNPMDLPSISFSTGLKQDGTVTAAYQSSCHIQISK